MGVFRGGEDSRTVENRGNAHVFFYLDGVKPAFTLLQDGFETMEQVGGQVFGGRGFALEFPMIV